jgi:hypothetical protein
MDSIIDDDIMSVISNDSYELLDTDENTIIIDGIEINKKEYLKTLRILQNIQNKKKENENEKKIINELQIYENELMEFYVYEQTLNILIKYYKLNNNTYNDNYEQYCYDKNKEIYNKIIIIKQKIENIIENNKFCKNYLIENINIIKEKLKMRTFYEISPELMNKLKNKCFNIIYKLTGVDIKKTFTVGHSINLKDLYSEIISFNLSPITYLPETYVIENENIKDVKRLKYHRIKEDFYNLHISIFYGIKLFYKDLLEIYTCNINENKILIDELNNCKKEIEILKNQNKLCNEKINELIDVNKIFKEQMNELINNSKSIDENIYNKK